MSGTNGVTNTSTLEKFGLPEKTKDKSDGLGQDAFMQLMITQLQNQDPMNPMEGEAFLGQLAQFGTVNGITQLQSSFNTLATALQSNQALQASTMVGRGVLVNSEIAPLGASGPVNGAIELPKDAMELVLNIKDPAGQVVRQITLGQKPEGLVDFKWDGLDNAGARVPAGNYKVSAEAMIDGKTVVSPVLLEARVESVTLQRNGASPQLNLAGLGSVSLDSVRQVM